MHVFGNASDTRVVILNSEDRRDIFITSNTTHYEPTCIGTQAGETSQTHNHIYLKRKIRNKCDCNKKIAKTKSSDKCLVLTTQN